MKGRSALLLLGALAPLADRRGGGGRQPAAPAANPRPRGRCEAGRSGTLVVTLETGGSSTLYRPIDNRRGQGMTGSLVVAAAPPPKGTTSSSGGRYAD